MDDDMQSLFSLLLEELVELTAFEGSEMPTEAECCELTRRVAQANDHNPMNAEDSEVDDILLLLGKDVWTL